MATERKTLKLTLPSDREVAMTRVFDAPREAVFDAWTKPEHLRRWFGSRTNKMIVCEVDLRVGGRYRFVWRLSEKEEMGIHGEYREIARPERLVNTEIFEGEYAEAMGGEEGGLNTLTLDERDGKTTMTLTSLYASKEVRDGVLATGMEEGAAESFDLLAELVEEPK
jgi:uncharacterized protein YndB with AHSA1/START domain